MEIIIIIILEVTRRHFDTFSVLRIPEYIQDVYAGCVSECNVVERACVSRLGKGRTVLRHIRTANEPRR